MCITVSKVDIEKKSFENNLLEIPCHCSLGGNSLLHANKMLCFLNSNSKVLHDSQEVQAIHLEVCTLLVDVLSCFFPFSTSMMTTGLQTDSAS